MDSTATSAFSARGVIALPADLRQRLHLDEPGAQLEITVRADGVVELRSALPVPADQAWFWTERWQQREREVDEHVAAGRRRGRSVEQGRARSNRARVPSVSRHSVINRQYRLASAN